MVQAHIYKLTVFLSTLCLAGCMPGKFEILRACPGIHEHKRNGVCVGPLKGATATSGPSSSSGSLSTPSLAPSVAPVLSFVSIAPTSPNWTTLTPTVTFSLSKASTVTLYSDKACGVTISAATSLTAGKQQSITTNDLPNVSNTSIYGKALDADGNASPCTALGMHTHVIKFIDPNPLAGNGFGTAIVELKNGNIVITSPSAMIGGVTAVGAVYLFNGSTGALISALTGSSTNDQVGLGGVTALTNGNFVVSSSNWNNGATNLVGAATWGDGTTGVSGAVSAANSLIGSTALDSVGNSVTALTNGNYVVQSYNWNNGVVSSVGAATWGNGATGITGVVSAGNSLIGSTAGDQVSVVGITALTNGNYVVGSYLWNNGATTSVGAATWGNGTTGITGAVSAVNSLVGSSAFDQVSAGGITALTNGNYVVASYSWRNGAIGNAGAATWGNGTTGVNGAVSAINSLVGSTANDQVGLGGVADNKRQLRRNELQLE